MDSFFFIPQTTIFRHRFSRSLFWLLIILLDNQLSCRFRTPQFGYFFLILAASPRSDHCTALSSLVLALVLTLTLAIFISIPTSIATSPGELFLSIQRRETQTQIQNDSQHSPILSRPFHLTYRRASFRLLFLSSFLPTYTFDHHFPRFPKHPFISSFIHTPISYHHHHHHRHFIIRYTH